MESIPIFGEKKKRNYVVVYVECICIHRSPHQFKVGCNYLSTKYLILSILNTLDGIINSILMQFGVAELVASE